MLGSITGREVQGFSENKEKIEIKKNLYSLYKDATQYYKHALSKNPEIKKYLFERWIKEDELQKFHFWYADSGIGLYTYLKEKWYEDEIIGQSNIFLDVRARKDKFIGRVIFPIQNLRGDFVAFAGRIVGQGEPKYLNSPASDIYDKSAILYGLYDARQSITKVDHIIITEWYMDTIALHKYGFFQTVAVSGTALTEKHITIIKRLTHKVYLCFDNDKAGEQATRNSLEILKNKGLEIRIIVLQWAKDPDEYLEQGKDFQTLIDTALSPIAYLIQKNHYNLESIDEKKKFIGEILDIIRNYSDSIEQDMYIKELSQISKTPLHIIYEMFRQTKAQKKSPENSGENTNISAEDKAIAYIYEKRDTIKEISESIIFPEWISSSLKKVLQDSTWFFQKLNLEKKERYKALAFSLFSEKTESEQQEILQKIILNINRGSYKTLSELYKKNIESDGDLGLQKYTELLQLAKKHKIK